MPQGRRDLPDPARVLAGHVPVRVEQLFDLIHAVNPTARDLDGRRREEAYATKARLQSLLIEGFGEQLRLQEIEQAPGRTDPEDVIGIAHRTYAKDACHAVVRQLSDRARAWVRLQRDLAVQGSNDQAPTAGRRRPAVAPTAADTDPLTRGHAALAAYDFVTAATLFRQAIEETPSDPAAHLAAVRALLGLWVDHLGDDQQALQLRQELSPAVLQDPDVCCLVALAAARGEQTELAERLVPADHERAPEIMLELARVALRAGRLDDCERLLGRVPPGSTAASDAQQLAITLREQRAAATRPQEQRLEALLAQDDHDASGRLAREILAAHPTSTIARAALARIRAAREAAEIRAETDAATAALATGDLPAARAAVARLRELQGATPQMEASLAAAEHTATATAALAAVAALVHTLQDGLDAAAVIAFWTADDDHRHRAHDQFPHPHIAWLLELGPPSSHARASLHAEAALALAQAEQTLANGDPEAAAAAAQPHEALALGCARGRAFYKNLRPLLAEHRRRSALARLDQAERTADAEPALRVLDAIPAGDLDPEGRARLEQLRQHLQHGLQLAGEREQLAAAEARGELLEAAALAARLSEHDAAGREGWLGEVRRLRDAVRRQWLEAFAEGPEEWHDLGPNGPAGGTGLARPAGAGPLLLTAPNGAPCVTTDGLGLVQAEACGSRLFVRLLHVDAARSRTAILRPSEPGPVVHVQVEQDEMWLCTASVVMRLLLDTFEVLEVHRLAALGLRDLVTQAWLVPGAQRLWLCGLGAAGLGIAIVDLRRFAIERQLEGCRLMLPAYGSAPPRAVVSRHHNDLELVDERGKAIWSERGICFPHAAVVRPDGRGLVMLLGEPRSLGSGSASMLIAASLGPEGFFGERLELGILNTDQFRQAATSLDYGSTFVSSGMREGSQLIALGCQGDGLAELWRVPAGPHLFLGHDSGGRHVLALANDGEQVTLTQLGAQRQRAGAARVAEELPRLVALEGCAWQPLSLRARVAAFEAVLPLLDEETIESNWRNRRQSRVNLRSLLALYCCSADPAERRQMVLEMAAVLAEGPATGVDVLQASDGDITTVHLLSAEQHLRTGKPEASLAMLDGIAPGDLPRESVQHAVHLRALALLLLGREREALGALSDQEVMRGQSCALGRLRALLEGLVASPRQLAPARGPTPLRFLHRLRQGDVALERGDWVAARQEFEHPAVWWHRHPQALARLVAAYLGMDQDDAAFMVRKRRVLAHFVDSMAGASPGEAALLGGMSWPWSRLEDLCARAHDLLGGQRQHEALDMNALRRLQRALSEGSAFLFTDVTQHGRITAKRGLRLDPIAAAEMLQPFARDLLESAREALEHTGRYESRVVGLVLAGDADEAEDYRAVLGWLLAEPVVARAIGAPGLCLVVTLESAFNLLLKWPLLFEHFERFHREAVLDDHLTLLFVAREGAGFHSVPWVGRW